MSSQSVRPQALKSKSRLRSALLGGSALCAASVGAAWAAGMPTQGVTVDLSNNSTAPVITKVLGAGPSVVTQNATTTVNVAGTVADVTLTAPRTLIDWTTFDVATGNTVNFDFASATGLVVNRVTGGGVITVDGNVNGVFGGGTAGSIWFLADGGVFLNNGVVKANEVLASNNVSVADLSILNDSDAVVKSELRAAGSLIDLTGTVYRDGRRDPPRTATSS